MEETSKEKPVSHAKILYDGKKSTEIDSLQISKLEDSSKESILSSEEFRINETFSGEKPSRALIMTGKIIIIEQCLHYDFNIVDI